MASVNTLSSTLVRPSVPPPYPFCTLHSSKLDLVIANIYVKTVYFFKPTNGKPDFFSSHVLIRALREALSHFYPMAGRVTPDLDIECNGEGVLFVEAEADCTVDELGGFKPDPQLLQLVPTLGASEDVTKQPLVIVQLTRFQCGGVALGVGVEHHVADGVSALSFLNSWSDIARGETFTGSPSFDKSWLKARTPPRPQFVHDEYLKLPQPTSVQVVCNQPSSLMETIETTHDKTMVNGVSPSDSGPEDCAHLALDEHSKGGGITLKRAMNEEPKVVLLTKLSKGSALESCTVKEKMNTLCRGCVDSDEEHDCVREEELSAESGKKEEIMVCNASMNGSVQAESLEAANDNLELRNDAGAVSSTPNSERDGAQKVSLEDKVVRGVSDTVKDIAEHNPANTDAFSSNLKVKSPEGVSSIFTFTGDGTDSMVNGKLTLNQDGADSMANGKHTSNKDHVNRIELYWKTIEDEHGRWLYYNENCKHQCEEVSETSGVDEKKRALQLKRQEGSVTKEGEEAIVSMFELPEDLMLKLKHAGKGRLSSYELLAAHVWKCCCEARDLGSKEESMLVMAVDGRARLKGPDVPEHYMGNAIFNCCPILPAGEVRHESVTVIADRIHMAIKRMDDRYCRSAIDFLELCSREQLASFVKGPHTFASPNMGFISWTKFPFYECDFGWGRPIHVGPVHMPWEGHAYVLPSPPHSAATAGSLRLCIALQRRHAHKFSQLLYNNVV